MKIAFLETIVHNTNGFRRLLRHSKLELPAAAVVIGERLSDCLQWVKTSGVVDLKCTESRSASSPTEFRTHGRNVKADSSEQQHRGLVYIIQRHRKIPPAIPRNLGRLNHIILIVKDLP
jgi:hypothetical protein